ncbi:MAG: phytanoyl-CoA dioxygenase family protein [Bacteroidetes bacterium]|nr:phytanoyl-CoA dioxygenase family protein [Bacteroidota bacterium]
MSTIPKIFIDDQLQKSFDENGYVTLPLINKLDIEKLKSLFYKYHPERLENAFQSTTFMDNKADKIEISKEIQTILLPYFNQFLCDFDALGSSFLFKTKGPHSELAAHQDWTIVDERKDIALNVWIPLSDTHEGNGALSVIPKTNTRYLFTLRAPTIPFFYDKNESILKKYLKSIPTKAGNAIVLNESLIHYSSANLEDDIRIAITSGVINKDAEMIFHFMDEKKRIEKFSIERDFLLSIEDFHRNIFKKPANLKSLGFVKNPGKIFSANQLKSFFEYQKKPPQSTSWLKKLKQMFE